MVANKKRFTLDLEPDFQRRLKVAAALRGINMRQYRVAAIEAELSQEQDAGSRGPGLSEEGLNRLSALRYKIFGGRMLERELELRTKEIERRSGD